MAVSPCKTQNGVTVSVDFVSFECEGHLSSPPSVLFACWKLSPVHITGAHKLVDAFLWMSDILIHAALACEQMETRRQALPQGIFIGMLHCHVFCRHESSSVRRMPSILILKSASYVKLRPSRTDFVHVQHCDGEVYPSASKFNILVIRLRHILVIVLFTSCGLSFESIAPYEQITRDMILHRLVRAKLMFLRSAL